MGAYFNSQGIVSSVYGIPLCFASVALSLHKDLPILFNARSVSRALTRIGLSLTLMRDEVTKSNNLPILGAAVDRRKILPDTVTRRWIEDRLDTLHPTHVEAFVCLLGELRALFDGDLDAMLILATTSLSTEGGDWNGALLQGKPLKALKEPTNTQSIALATGIPRETVRRKLKWLEGKGWVERDVTGNWSPTAATGKELKRGTKATISYLKTILNAAQNAECRDLDC